METRFIATLLFASLLFSIVSAQPVPTADKTTLLNSALTDMKCKVAFETGIMNAIIEKFPSLSSSLNSHISELQLDVPQLTQYASRGDVLNYSIYVQETFTPHMVNAATAQKEVIDSVKGSSIDKDVAKASMQSLKSTFGSLSATQESCFDAREHANLVINYYNNSLNLYEMRAKNLSDRNIGSDLLFNLVANARAQILLPLESEVKSAGTNSSQLGEALSKYCLYDGCLNGTNFHMAAKFETARLLTLLNVVYPEALNTTINRDDVKIRLDNVNVEINSWGTLNAKSDQLNSTWVNIRTAAKDLHQIYIELGGATGSS